MDTNSETRPGEPDARGAAAPGRDCPCCGSRTPFELLCAIQIAKPASYPGDDELRVGTCASCGMGYSEDGVTQEALDAYYANSAKYADLAVYSTGHEAGSLDSEAPWELERSENLMRFAESFVSKSEFILDVGCSTGTALVILRNDGYERLGGIDPLRASVVVARDARQLDVIEGRFGTPHPAGRPDVVVASHVLEHVLDVHEAIDSIVSTLAEGGRVVVEVPDASRFHEHVYAPFQDFNTEHINHFSLSHLGALMASHGFEVLRLEEALVRSGPHHIYPVVRGIWQYTGTSVDAKEIADSSGAMRAALATYAAVSEAIFEQIDARVREGIGDQTFVLWGAGQFAMKLMKRDSFPLDQCVGIVDASPSRHGLQIGQFTVGHPEDLTSAPPPVVLPGSVFGAESIVRAVEALGISSRVVALSD